MVSPGPDGAAPPPPPPIRSAANGHLWLAADAHVVSPLLPVQRLRLRVQRLDLETLREDVGHFCTEPMPSAHRLILCIRKVTPRVHMAHDELGDPGVSLVEVLPHRYPAPVVAHAQLARGAVDGHVEPRRLLVALPVVERIDEDLVEDLVERGHVAHLALYHPLRCPLVHPHQLGARAGRANVHARPVQHVLHWREPPVLVGDGCRLGAAGGLGAAQPAQHRLHPRHAHLQRRTPHGPRRGQSSQASGATKFRAKQDLMYPR